MISLDTTNGKVTDQLCRSPIYTWWMGNVADFEIKKRLNTERFGLLPILNMCCALHSSHCSTEERQKHGVITFTECLSLRLSTKSINPQRLSQSVSETIGLNPWLKVNMCDMIKRLNWWTFWACLHNIRAKKMSALRWSQW